MAETVVDIVGAIVGGAIGFIAGELINPLGGGLVGASIGGTAGWNAADAYYKTTHPDPTANNPPATTSALPPTVGGVPTPLAPAPPVPPSTPVGPAGYLPTDPNDPRVANDTALAVARSQMEEAQRLQFEEQSGMAIFGHKVQEQTAESAFRANVATRGLKFEGSPLAALAGKKQMGEGQIGLEERQRTASSMGMGLQSTIEFNTFKLKQSLDVYNYNQGQANLWINAFTNTINFASGVVGKFWNPAYPDLSSAMGGGGGGSAALRPD